MYSFVIIDTFAAKESESEHSNNTNFVIKGDKEGKTRAITQ